MLKLEESIKQLHQLFTDMAVMVESQVSEGVSESDGHSAQCVRTLGIARTNNRCTGYEYAM